jgi:arylsulfatase A-like enzyme
MVWKDAIQAGAVVDEPLHIVDLYPTLLGRAGAKLDQPKPLDGKDAWATIAQGRPSPHEVLLLNVTPFQGAVRVGALKLIHNGYVRANATSVGEKETWELFDLASDPFEKQDLSQTHPGVLQRLKSRLAALAEQAVQPNIPPNKAPEGFRVPKDWGHSH